MKTNKFFVSLVVVFVVAMVAFVIDSFLGINFENVSKLAEVTHKVMYMLVGTTIHGTLKWLQS